MATKERIIELIDSLPDTPENQMQLDDIQHKLEPNDLSEDEAMLTGHEAAIERLRADPVQWASWQAEIAELDERFADVTEGQVRAAMADSE